MECEIRISETNLMIQSTQKYPAYLSAKNHISGNLQEKVKIICIILGCDKAIKGNDQSQISLLLIPLAALAGALCTAYGAIG